MLLALCATLTFAACTPQKELPVAAEQEALSPPAEIPKKNGTIGVIHQATTKDGCPWTIQIKEVEYLLDPTDLEEEFMVDGLRVRFDYLPLRMKNRCKEANPIRVLSMVKMK
ncbi:MAG: hypothetical protein IPO60_04165 [Flavobacteriales bacterium]|nr:hypothetical protein [Flavobacteriales bacterium]MBK6892359.1 hypothetical protein [Flavobacteriales bacterium]MBK7246499.1 hypothetical protein [Flavobacteriales bacterium]MBK9060674.1 hypothetical protein [Flavobacteriales bacterium]MBK9597531.1 hypothetical protein [Flavobacteriales bacterium]